MAITNDANDGQISNESGNGAYCDGCGEDVTREYHRVFSDNEGVLRSFLWCTAKGESRSEWR